MAHSGRSPMFARLVVEGNLLTDFRGGTVGSFFEYAFAQLKETANRHEYVYKAAITEKVLLGTHSLRTASMLTEFRVGPCKADVVILNGTGTVYEIKSERDSLSRLSRQLDAYRGVFPVVNVIVGEQHTDEVIASVSSDVGVMQLSDRYRISTIRTPSSNVDHLSSASILESMTMKEAELVLRELGTAIPEVPNTRRYAALSDAFAQISPIAAHAAMVSILKRTRSLLPISELVEALPKSLHSLVLSGSVRKQDYRKIIDAVATPFEVASRWGEDGLPSVFSW